MTAHVDPQRSPAPEPHSDEQLLQELGRGNEDALRVLHQRYAALVFTVAARFVDTATAEDVVQDVFVTLWKKHHTFDPSRGSFKSWIVQIARHRALNEVRGKKVLRHHSDASLGELASDSLEPDEMQWREHRRAVIQRAVDALPVAQRQALSLAFFDELTHEQVAEALRTPVGTTKTRIRLALRRLAPSLLAVLSAGLLVFTLRRHDRDALRNALRDDQALRMVTASDVVPLRLGAGPGIPNEAHGTYRTRPGANVAVLTTSSLPALSASERYAAWAHLQRGWQYLGFVTVGSDGRSVNVSDVDPTVNFDELRVTVEATGEQEAPRGKIALLWARAEGALPR